MDFNLQKYHPIPDVPCNRSFFRLKFLFFFFFAPAVISVFSFSGAYALIDNETLHNLIGGSIAMFVFYFFINHADKMEKQYTHDCSHLYAYLVELNSDIEYYREALLNLPPDAPSDVRSRISGHLASLRGILKQLRVRIPKSSDFYSE